MLPRVPQGQGHGVLVDLSEGRADVQIKGQISVPLDPGVAPTLAPARAVPRDTAVASWPRWCSRSGAVYTVKGVAAAWVPIPAPPPAACATSLTEPQRWPRCAGSQGRGPDARPGADILVRLKKKVFSQVVRKVGRLLQTGWSGKACLTREYREVKVCIGDSEKRRGKYKVLHIACREEC